MLTAVVSPIVRALAPASRFARRLRADRRGISAVEFGILAPVLVGMFGGVLELSGAITAANRSTFIADAVAEMVSRVDHTVTDAELKNIAVSAALIDPDIVKYARQSNKDIESAFKITITSVQFEPKILTCLLLGCTYDANVVFSYTLNGTKRACKKLKAADSDAQTEKTLPSDVFGPGSLVVVDVETYYSPIMPIRLSDTISFKRSSYFRPRYVSRVDSDNNCKSYD